MKILIVRHGIAEDYHPDGDAARELTDRGREKVRGIIEFIRKTIEPDLLLSSPLVRALQTAEIALSVLEADVPLEQSRSLLPGSGSQEIILELQTMKPDTVMLFGHNPHLSYLVSDLLSRGTMEVQLKKASVTAVDFEGLPLEGGGILKWMVTPGLLRL